MGDTFDGKFKLGSQVIDYSIPTLMEYFTGKSVTHIEIGYKFAVIATRIDQTLFTKVPLHKRNNTYQDVTITCKQNNKHPRTIDEFNWINDSLTLQPVTKRKRMSY